MFRRTLFLISVSTFNDDNDSTNEKYISRRSSSCRCHILREILYRLYPTINESSSKCAENDDTMITNDAEMLFASTFVYDGREYREKLCYVHIHTIKAYLNPARSDDLGMWEDVYLNTLRVTRLEKFLSKLISRLTFANIWLLIQAF